MAELRRHRTLLIAVALLETTSVLLFELGNARVPFEQSWLGTAEQGSGLWFLLFWTWLVAVPLIALLGFWSKETGPMFYLEIWRRGSAKQWLARRLVVSALVVAALSGLELPMLLITFGVKPALALKAGALLSLYILHIALIYVTVAARTGEFVVPLLGVLAYTTGNLVLDRLGYPNIVEFFLVGERASPVSFVLALGLLGAGFFLLRDHFDPSIITLRGSEYV
jgi:hypothetical protein